MKLSTLAVSNIKRNFKKYVMYFFSLSFSVFTTYTFFALTQNEIVLMASDYDMRYRSLLRTFAVIILVFVLFFLINSNKSFIKARKKEISTYSLFGMTNGRIGKLLFLENFIVGIVAIVIGIGAGIFFSKLMVMILLDIAFASFVGNVEFSISPNAAYITALIFIGIFSIISLSGLRVINKFELVDLFKASKVSEGRTKGSTLVLILSLIITGSGYYLALNPDPFKIVNLSIPILLLVIIGTYLFFWGGLPKVLNLIKINKNSYYRKTNLISVSSFSHRIKSIGAVMATITILSAVATTAVATGYTLYSNIQNNVYETLGFDLHFSANDEKVVDNVRNIFKKHGNKIIHEFTGQIYTCLPSVEVSEDTNSYFEKGENKYFKVYSQSLYNKFISISKTINKPLDVKSGEVLYLRYRNPISNRDTENDVIGKELIFTDKKLTITSFETLPMLTSGSDHTIVINDEDFDHLLKSKDITNINPNGQPNYKETVFMYKNALRSPDLHNELNGILSENTASFKIAYNLYNDSLQTFGLVCFIGFFMGAVFILMTASLLYFKQIMAAEEERHHYKILRKIGMDEATERKVIAKRLMPVFLIPLLVGIIHSIFAMKTADTVVFTQMILSSNSYIKVLMYSSVMYGIYAIVYSIFYFITKSQYLRIVK